MVQVSKLLCDRPARLYLYRATGTTGSTLALLLTSDSRQPDKQPWYGTSGMDHNWQINQTEILQSIAVLPFCSIKLATGRSTLYSLLAV